MTRFCDIFDLLDNKTTIAVYMDDALVGEFTKYYFPHILFDQVELCEVECISVIDNKAVIKVIEQ